MPAPASADRTPSVKPSAAARPPVLGAPVRQRTLSPGTLAASLVAAGAVLLFGFLSSWGYLPLVAGIALGFAASRPLGRDLLLIGVGLGIVSTISVEADISWGNIALMGFVLTAAVAVPYALSRFAFRDEAISFPRRQGRPWTKLEWGWLVVVLFLGWAILPRYFITSGAYQNWPAVESASEIGRLFVGVNAVGIWDELFFICTIFTLLYRHFSFWTANVITSVIFVSFLWELGYREWAPFITIPFALVQAVIFTKTKSLPYTVCVHLLFDLIVFLSIIHAHHREWVPIFWY